MKISLNWLKEFVPVAADPAGLKTALTGAGLGVESVTPAGDDCIFEIEVTTNRPDCLNHFGVAREVSAIYRLPLKPLEIRVAESGDPAASAVSVEIADPDLCARFCGRVVRNLTVKPSPAWLGRRLETVGVRSINNVADVTNYVLMELGQPLHAYDLARLADSKIIARRARPGERLKTLDGVERTLTGENLVIADGRLPVGIAGVMGGEDSEISSATHSVLLEGAWFEPVSVRRTAKSQGLHTEASHRFERGVDIEMAPVAIDRAAALVQELAGGEILQGLIDVYPRPAARPSLVLRASEIRRILGADLEPGEVERILRSLGFDVSGEDKGEGRWRVAPPSFRVDVGREVDLIEEVARISGYDRLPARVRPAPPRVERDTRREKEFAVTSTLVALGYREIISSSMVDPAENARFTDQPPVVLANPLSQEASALRSSSIPSMVAALRWNLDRGQSDLRLFEMGKTYTAPPGAPPAERRVLTLGLSGARREKSVHDAEKPLDFFDLKGDLESLLEEFDIRGLRFKSDDCRAYEPRLAGRYTDSTGTLVVFGKLAADAARDHKLRQDVWLGELDLERLLASPLRTRTFRAYSKFPAVERDFSLVLPDQVCYQQVDEAVRGALETSVQSVRPVDVFRGGSIPEGHYSLLLRVTFSSLTHTLTSDEVDRMGRTLLEALEPLGVRLRGQPSGG